MSGEKNRSIIYLVVGVLLLLGLITMFGGKKKQKFDWEESYELNGKEPYGLDLFEKLLESYTGENEFLRVEERFGRVFNGGETNSNYVMIGQAFLYQEEEINDMLDYVSNGNTAFFSCKSIPFDFLAAAIPESCYMLGLDDFQVENEIYDSLVTMDFEHPELTDYDGYPMQYYRNGELSMSHRWTYISRGMLCDSFISPVEIGTVSDHMNFMKINYGEGQIYLHSTPMAFSNFHIIKEKNLEYVEKVLAHLQPGDIYWDVKHHIAESVSRRRNEINTGKSSSPQGFQETPLKYILSQPPLAWAWYTLVGMGLLYLIFRAKRRQRIIPVTEPVTNTSLEFIDTIGKLHFQRGNPRQVIFQKMKYLQNFIKNRYGLAVQDWDENFIKKLNLKSEVPTDLLSKIQTMHRNVTTSRFASDNTLMDFHKLVEEFFRLKK